MGKAGMSVSDGAEETKIAAAKNKLREAKAMLEDGLITQDDYDAVKQKFIASFVEGSRPSKKESKKLMTSQDTKPADDTKPASNTNAEALDAGKSTDIAKTKIQGPPSKSPRPETVEPMEFSLDESIVRKARGSAR